MNAAMPELFTLQVLPQKSSKKSLFLNKRQLDCFQFIPGQQLNLQVGFNRLALQVEEHNIDSSLNTLYLSRAAYSDLTHYHGESLWLAFVSSNKMFLGPTLGITVSSKTWKMIEKIYAIEKRALLALEKGIIFYCFHLGKVDLEKSLVEAYYMHPRDHKWRKTFLPLPHVLYHRSAFPFAFHAMPSATNIFYNKIWINPTIKKINSNRAFDKWNVYQALTRYAETSRMQPETALLEQLALEEFLNKYNFCYVKNIYGKGGRQVFRVKKTGAFYLCKAGGKKIRLWNFKNFNTLYYFLRRKLGKNLIIQRGISLASLNNKPFDIRVLMQKNINAEWVISALSFRIADAGAVVTNIAAGAKEIALAPDNNLLGTGLSISILKDFTFKTLFALEAFYGNLGEIGLDIGLDNNGNLWLFEANSQPSSRGYKEAASEELCNEIFGLPLDYAKYLAKRMFIKFEGGLT